MSDEATLRPVAKQIRLDTEGMRAGATDLEASSERVSSQLSGPTTRIADRLLGAQQRKSLVRG